MLLELGQPDFLDLRDPKQPPPRRPDALTGERPIPGFVCPSEPRATAAHFPAPISYRATTGDTPRGENGAFAPGRQVRLADVEAGDGLSYTAAFAERLVGDGRKAPAAWNYAR